MIHGTSPEILVPVNASHREKYSSTIARSQGCALLAIGPHAVVHCSSIHQPNRRNAKPRNRPWQASCTCHLQLSESLSPPGEHHTGAKSAKRKTLPKPTRCRNSRKGVLRGMGVSSRSRSRGELMAGDPSTLLAQKRAGRAAWEARRLGWCLRKMDWPKAASGGSCGGCRRD